MTTFYFAWAESTDTTFGPGFAVNDEDVFAFRLAQEEGGFATLDVSIRHPSKGLLAASRDRWAWFSYADGGAAAALFFGRVVGAPEGQTDTELRLTLLARPDGYHAAKEAVAATLRSLPDFDPVWIAADVREDPDVVLEARSALWHVDRTSHAVTISDICEGEDGTIAIAAADLFADSLDLAYTGVPVTRVDVRATMAWDQRAQGEVDVTRSITDAAATAGTTRANILSSYTGLGLVQDWWAPGFQIGGGWRVTTSTLRRMDGRYFGRSGRQTPLRARQLIYFPLWSFAMQVKIACDVTRGMTEIATFAVNAGVQEVGSDDAEPLVLEFSSTAAAESIDGAVPIGNVAGRSWFRTDRGRQSLQNLALRARAALRASARVVEVSAQVSFETAVQLTCRHSASITASALPGGSVTGKVIAYAMSLDGDSGALIGEVTLGCTVGDGVALSPAAAVLGYADAGYVDDGYQEYVAGDESLSGGDTTLAHYGGVEFADDGIDFGQMDRGDIVLSAAVVNGQTAQEAVIDTTAEDASEAKRNLEGAFTRVEMDLRPLGGLAFENAFAIDDGAVSLPKTIDLEAE